MKPIPYLNMQPPFLEALRPLHGQIKLSVMHKNLPTKIHPVNTMTGLSIIPRERL